MPQKQKKRVQRGHTKGLSQRTIQALARSEECKMNGKHEEALKIAESILMEDPSCVEAAEEVSDNLLSLERIKEASRAAQYALFLSPKSYIANFVLGFVASQEEAWGKSIAFFQMSNAGQPNNPEILRCLGWSLFHSGKRNEGIATLRRALFLRNDDPAILCDLAACYLQMNLFEKAITLLEKAISINKGDDRVQELVDLAKKLRTAFSEDIP